MARGQGRSSNTPASTFSGVIGSQRGGPSVRTDANKPYACSTCGKCFAEAYYVKMHQTVHTKERPFKCKLCYKSFSFLTNLIRHRSSADAESAGPGVKQERRGGEEDPQHSRDIETGVPPVAMEDHTTAPAQPRTCHSIMECEKRFSRQDHLKMHLKVHTGERPFACTQCGKRFSERSYLRMHQQKNHSTR
nr:gastrula zinc finger protein XlCGF71.1-like [Oncorhynchus nerka]